MSNIVIQLDGLGKRYRVGQRQGYRTLRDSVTQIFRAPFRRSSSERRKTEMMWALRHVSFDVKHGEVIGIIGRNGAGKSTLLKLLSRITEPTEGRAEISGRVGSLLEVGTGFHPELTGRENIFLNGAILGMKKVEIASKFDEIVAFAEVERHIDTAVKHYSSGMYTRLAFAVAAHLEPEILLVDEVLAVGDMAFQKKCLGKIRDVATGGRTVLFVSHNMAAMQTLCDRAVWLRDGQVSMIGDVHQVVGRYLQSATESNSELVWPDSRTAPGNDEARLHRISVKPRYTSDAVTVAMPLDVEVWFWAKVDFRCWNVSIEVYNIEEICVFSSFSAPAVYPRGIVHARCEIPGNLLNDSTYRFKVLIVRDGSEIVLYHSGVSIEIHDGPRDVPYFGKWIGGLRPILNWSTKFFPEAENGSHAKSSAPHSVDVSEV